MYNRAQNIKTMLRSEIEYNDKIKEQLNKSALNKILVVTHNEVMLALTAKSVSYDPTLVDSFHGPFKLEGGKQFNNCEVYPYDINENFEDYRYFQ